MPHKIITSPSKDQVPLLWWFSSMFFSSIGLQNLYWAVYIPDAHSIFRLMIFDIRCKRSIAADYVQSASRLPASIKGFFIFHPTFNISVVITWNRQSKHMILCLYSREITFNVQHFSRYHVHLSVCNHAKSPNQKTIYTRLLPLSASPMPSGARVGLVSYIRIVTSWKVLNIKGNFTWVLTLYQRDYHTFAFDLTISCDYGRMDGRTDRQILKDIYGAGFQIVFIALNIVVWVIHWAQWNIIWIYMLHFMDQTIFN